MNNTRLTIELDPEIKREFKGKASFEGKNLKEKIIELILAYLEK